MAEVTWKTCKQNIFADYKRLKLIGGGNTSSIILKILLNTHKNIVFFFRVGTFLKTKQNIAARLLYKLIGLWYVRKQLLTGIQLPLGTDVGGGLAFIHFSNIVIAESCKIGKNCTILQGVTLGHSFSAKNDGVPTLGDNVVVFAGAKVLGKVKVGDKAVIAANAVVTKDVPANSIVAGNPAKVISTDTSSLFGKKWAKDYAR